MAEIFWTLTREQIELNRQLRQAFETYMLQISPLNALLLANGRNFEAGTNVKYEWPEFVLKRIETTVGANYTSGSFTSTPANLVLGTTANFKAWDTMRFENTSKARKSDLMLYVTEIVDGTTLKVMKVWGTDVALAIGDIAVFANTGKEENSSKWEIRKVDIPGTNYNYFQIIDALYEISRSLQGSNSVLNQGKIAKLREAAFYRMSRQFTEMLSNGIRAKITDPVKGKDIHFSGWIWFYIGTAIAWGWSALTLDKLNQAFEEIVLWGWLPDAIRCNTKQARAISALDRSKLTINLADKGTWTVVQMYQADIPIKGSKIDKIIVDTSMPQDEIEMFDMTKMALVPYSNGGLTEKDATEAWQDWNTIRVLAEYTYVHVDATNTARRITDLAQPT